MQFGNALRSSSLVALWVFSLLQKTVSGVPIAAFHRPHRFLSRASSSYHTKAYSPSFTVADLRRRRVKASCSTMAAFPDDERMSLTSNEDDSNEVYNKAHTPLQCIYDHLSQIENMHEACHDPLQHYHIREALVHMNQVTLEELGLSMEYLQSINYGQCMLVATVPDRFQIAAFLLPRGFALQLHDHPEMTVCSRMLQGSARIRSFSGEQRNEQGDIIDASLFVDMHKSTRDEAWLLTPSHGNFHEIYPTTDCVMLDILLPPYDDRIRPCKFYKPARNTPLPNSSSSISAGAGTGAAAGVAAGAGTTSTSSTGAITAQNNDWTLKLLPAHLQQRVRLPLNVAYNGYQPSQSSSTSTMTHDSTDSQQSST